MVTNISEAQSTSTQIINNADNEDNVNPPKPAILVELYNALSKAKNKKSLYWGYDEDEGWSVYFENGLESESDYHQGEMDSYQFFAMDNNKIQAVYTVNGYDKPNLTVSSALEW